MIHHASATLKMVRPGGAEEAKVLARIQQCRHGVFCYFPHDIYIGAALDKYGEYIEEELRLLLSCVNEGDVVIEVGANIGCDTVPLARKVTNSGRIFAFEPQRIIYQMLCGNLAINGLWNVIAERAAIGAGPGILQVPPVDYSQNGNFGGVSLAEKGAEPVQVIALDAYKLTRCELLKIDVEGMELDVLRGAADTIGRLRPIIYCENDRDEKAPALIEFLRSMKYDLYWHTPQMYGAENYRQNPVNDFRNDKGESLVSINMLCLPSERGLNPGLPPVAQRPMSGAGGMSANAQILRDGELT